MRKTSVYVYNSSEKSLLMNGNMKETQSVRMNFVWSYAKELLESPRLTLNEYLAVISSVGNVNYNYKQLNVCEVIQEFVENIQYQKFITLNSEELAMKIHVMKINEKVFLFELSRKFWLFNKDISLDKIKYKNWLILNGANLKEGE